MKKQSIYQLAAVLFIAAIVAAMPKPAQAAGTAAGFTVTNSVTVDYQVGGVQQTQKSTSVNFVVDDKVVFTVADSSGPQVTTYPSSTTQALKFVISNSSNTVHDFTLSATDINDASSVGVTFLIYDGSCGETFGLSCKPCSGASCASTSLKWSGSSVYIDELASDASMTFYVVPSVTASAPNNATFNYTVTAKAYQGGGVGSLGADSATKAATDKTFVKSSAAGTLGIVYTILADAAGDGDALYDGLYKKSGINGFKVSSASLTVNKYASVFSDPISGNTITGGGTNNPKAIPGAVVIYSIVLNNGGSTNATNVAINDNLSGMINTYFKYGRLSGATNLGYLDNATSCAANSNLTIAGNNGSATPYCVADTDALVSGNTVSAINLTVVTGGTVTVSYEVTIQ